MSRDTFFSKWTHRPAVVGPRFSPKIHVFRGYSCGQGGSKTTLSPTVTTGVHTGCQPGCHPGVYDIFACSVRFHTYKKVVTWVACQRFFTGRPRRRAPVTPILRPPKSRVSGGFSREGSPTRVGETRRTPGGRPGVHPGFRPGFFGHFR